MPEITSKEHYKSLSMSSDLSNYDILEETTYPHETLEAVLTFSTYTNKSVGVLIVMIGEKVLCNVHFNFLLPPVFTQNTIQIKSIVVDADSQNLGIGPMAYTHLVTRFKLVSDTIQTRAGAHQWHVKLGSSEDINIHVVDNFPNNPEFRLDSCGDRVIYTYKESNVSQAETIWSMDMLDDRLKDPDFNYSTSVSREDVVLHATIIPSDPS